MTNLYFAYGANINIWDMEIRCPNARPVGAFELRDWQLELYSHATIQPNPGQSVHGVLWDLTPECEQALADLKDKVDSASRGRAENAVNDLKQAMEGDDAERIRTLSEQLSHIVHALSQTAYGQNEQPGAPGNQDGANAGPRQRTAATDDDVVDADFEEVA